MKYIVAIEEAPRSKKRTVYIAKMRGEDTFVYDTWAKCDYANEAVSRNDVERQPVEAERA